jgi:hypothetical protein
MAQSLIADDWSERYIRQFHAHVHQLLAWGYADARHKITATCEEDDITGFICEAIQDRINNPDMPSEFGNYDCRDQARLRHAERTGKNRRIIDIVIVRTGDIRPHPELLFEAKRLAKNAYPIGLYIGPDGLQCYTSGEYAPEHSVAGMIGYMQSASAAYWFPELLRSLKKHPHHGCATAMMPCKDIRMPSLPDEYLSEHYRPGRPNITIWHIFLDCT